MYRGQVYNASGWQSPQASASRETSRRLDRRIRQNMGILDRSRHSNQSNSIRMKRTENSGDRMQHSRDREPNSQQTSGIISQGFNDSMRRVPRRMGSVLSLSRRRQPYESNRIQAAGSRSGKNIVQNLYMLTNNVPQYSDRRHHYQHDTQPYEQRYNSKQARQRYEGQQSYDRQQPLQRYPQRNGNNYHERSQDRFREQGHRSSRNQTPTRRSVLRSRRSKEGNGDERVNISRDRQYKHVGSRDVQRIPGDTQIRKLEQKYMENIYELNSPKGRGRGQNRGNRQKIDRGNKIYDQQYRERGKPPHERRDKDYGQAEQLSSPRTHNNDYNRHRRQPDRRPYPEQRDRKYPAERDRRPYQDREYHNRDDRRYPEKNGGYDHRYREEFYDQVQYQRDPYRNHPAYREKEYDCRDYRDRRKDPKIYSNNSGKNYPYYQDQIPSTTVGVKTLPQISRYDSISDAPIHSIGSQKEVSRHNMVEQLPAKHSVKLDRPKGRPVRGPKRQQNRLQEESNIEDRLHKNNIKLQERPPEKWDSNKRRVLQDPVSPGKLPTGSMFLPVQSKRYQPREETQLTLQKIILHLQNLNLIADYTKDFKKMYENVEPWQVLIFLTYKKFYIERTKATTALKATPSKNSSDLVESLQGKENPFALPYSKISEEQLSKFKETKECFALLIELQAQNTKIRNALRGLYNLYIQKSGQFVNMLDCDNFSNQIYKFMIEQLDGISENLQDVELVTPTRIRMGKIIKVGLLIAFLDGKYVKNFPQILIHEDMIKIGKRQTLREDSISHLFIEEFRRVLC